MRPSSKALFCGPSTLRINQLYNSRSNANIFNWFGSKDVIYTHKARVAVKLALDILGIGHGDKILAPSYNCGTEIDVLISSGISVELYRIDSNCQIDLEDLVRRLTKQVKAIYVTNYFGFPQPLKKLRNICDQNDLYLIEDCALSLFSCNSNVKLGTIGDISVFSFPKSLPVPDGGAMVINNPELNVNKWQLKQPSTVKIFKNLLPFVKRGLLRSSSEFLIYPMLWSILKKRHKTFDLLTSEFPDMPASYYYDEKLNNKGLSRITKYLLTQFDIPDIIAKRRRNFKKYLSLLSEVKTIQSLYNQLPEGICPLSFPVITKNHIEICNKLNNLSIDAIAWWAGYHRDLPWHEFPDTCFLKNNVLTLPVHEQLSEKHIEFITQNFLIVVRKIQA